MAKSVTFPVQNLESLEETIHPWKPVLQKILTREPDSLELTFPFNGMVYFCRRCGDRLTVTSLGKEDEHDSFPMLRSAHTALLNRMRRHVEGHIHNLRSPLSGIRSRTELMIQYVESTELTDPGMVERLLSQIKRSTGRVLDASDQLNEQLRNFDQIFRWLDHTHETTPLQFRQVVAELHAFYMTNLTFKRSIEWEQQLPDHMPPVVVRPYLLVEPIMHIIDNAIDTLGECNGGQIAVSASTDRDGYLDIRIRNSGPALCTDSPFEQMLEAGHGTRANAPGSGLTFAYWLVTEAGGKLSLTANDEGNVVFSLSYPLKQS